MEVLTVSGTLGSGKTTTLVGLLTTRENLDNVHLVINEVGTFATDIDRINQATGGKLDVAGLTAGCLGCANLAEFIEIVEELAGQDSLLLIEPTGVADGHEIRAALAHFAMPWNCLTLVNPDTFWDDMQVGVLESQLEVATIVGITRPERLHETDRDKLLLALAPYGAPTVDVPLEGFDLTVNELLKNGMEIHVSHPEHCDCGHDHDHSHHHDDHHGGHITTPVILNPSVTADALRDMCEQLNARRVKGVIEGKWFDCVGGSEFTVGEKREEESYAIFIDTKPLPEEVVATLSISQDKATVPLKQRLAHLSQDEAHAQINRLLAQAGDSLDAAGNLRLSDESIDLAFTVAKARGSDEFRAKAMQARIRHTLAVYDLLAERKSISPSQLVEIGAVLAWQTAMRTDDVGEYLLLEVQKRQPATMWLTGLEWLANEAPPRYDLMAGDYSGPLSPEAAVVIAKWGFEHESLDRNWAIQIFAQMTRVSASYPGWSDRWLNAIEQLRPAHV